MYIERLEIKGFGKLSGFEFNLRNGLNFIYGQNESGKTTLQNFIKAMLYGLKGGKPSKDGIPAPGKRFRPWGVGSFGGTMEFRLDNGLFFRVERDFDRNAVEVYDDHFSNITSSLITGRDKSLMLAERYTGLNEACFEKTVFVKQLETSLGEDDGALLLNRLANAAETGFEDISFKKAENALKNAIISQVGTDRTSVRPLDRLSARLAEIESLKNSIKAAKIKLQQAFSDLQAVESGRVELLKRKDFLDKIGKLVELRRQLGTQMVSETSMKEAARLIQEVEAKLESETIDPNIPSIAAKSTAMLPKPIISLSIALLVLSVAAAVFGKRFEPYTYGAAALMLGGAAFLITSSLLREGRRLKMKEQEARVNRMDRLAVILQLKDRQKELYSKASLAWGVRLGTVQELKEALAEASDSIRTSETALERDIKTASSFYGGSSEDPFNIDNLEAVIYDSSQEWLEKNLAAETEQVSRALTENALKKRELETLLINDSSDDEALQNIAVEEAELKLRKTELERTGEALRLALHVLNESGAEIRGSLTPMLDRRMSAIAGSITGGRYTDLRIDDSFGIKTVIPETGGVNGIRLLSGGTVDQLYLALRLAMADVLAPEGENLPIFLDEVFSQYDDIRTEQTLKFLFEEYSDRQVLLFTCKERELEAAREICGDQFNLLTL